MVERQGNVRTFKVEDMKHRNIRGLIVDNVAIGTKIYTDEYGAYRGLGSFYRHEAVNHGIGEYVRGLAHTNTAEGFFSQLKRGIYGIYHWVSEKHLERYLDEFSFRYDIRKQDNGVGFYQLVENCAGRLTYKELIA